MLRSLLRRAGQERGAAGGFTLLEVMIALAILGLSLTALGRSQLASARAAGRAKMLTIATMLARYKMIEIEDTLFEEGFSDFDKKETKSFKEDGFERFSYTFNVEKVELPAELNAEGMADAIGDMAGDLMPGAQKGKDKDKAGAPAGMAASLGAGMIGKQMEMIRNVLEQSIRRVELRVHWKEGKTERDITVVAYFTDPRKIDAALGGGLPSNLDELLKRGSGTTGTGTGGDRTGGSRTTPPSPGGR